MSKTSRRGRRIAVAAVAAGAAVVAGTALAGGPLSGRSLADAAQGGNQGAAQGGPAQASQAATTYQFQTLDNTRDATFNQLLGINNQGTIAGYFGSGAAGHPNQGYLLFPPYGPGNYASGNFPGSAQTQVTGLNDRGVTVGFWSSMNNASLVNDNFGFWERDGRFRTADFPTGAAGSPPVDQLLGVNDGDTAVGFWTDAAGNNHGYKVNIDTGRFSSVTDPGAPGASLTAAAINNGGDIAGFYTSPATGNTDGFLKADGKFTDLAVPGASATSALGVNDHDEVVGTYTVGSGSGAVMHGFTWTPGGGFTTVDAPHGIGTTTVNGVNDAGRLVGFYVDAAGNTDGFLASPVRVHKVVTRVPLAPMPQGTVTLGRDGAGNVDVTVSAFGLTPGSAHTVELVNGGGGVVTTFGTLTADAAGQAQATLDSGYQDTLGAWRVEILGGTAGDPVSAEPIAKTSRYSAGQGTYQLNAVEVDQNGQNLGTPQGTATFVYDPAAKTIAVTVSASGLTPGAHAAHIHAGSCQLQGAVQYMLTDFTANGSGQIVDQTRTVTNVTAPLPANNSWYLNLHQGNSNDILANGNPTINFRPLLCGEIVTQP